MVLAVCCTVVFSQTQEVKLHGFETSRGVFSLDVGLVTDLDGSSGYSACIKSVSFAGESPFYYGFGSLLGTFSNTKMSFFETGLIIGYTKGIEDSNLYYDVFLDFLVTGGRIDAATSLYQAEAPALHLGLSLGFPASSNIDGALSIGPVIRPYNLKAKEWDFSRSYINFSLTIHFKSSTFGKKVPWSESNASDTLTGEIR